MDLPVMTEDDFLRDLRRELLDGGFTQVDGASGVMMVAGPLIRQLGIVDRRSVQALSSWSPVTSVGSDLDRIAGLLGLTRRSPARAFSQAFRFYIPNGQTYSQARTPGLPTVGTIPGGTLVFNPSNPAVRYQTLQPAVFQPDSTDIFVPIQAVQTGTETHLRAGILTGHSASDYASVVSCTNDQPIDAGQDRESDSNLRFRLTRRVEELVFTTAGAIEALVLGIPGVRNTRVTSRSRGPGTLSIQVVSQISPASDTLLDRVRAVVTDRIASGISVEVTTPTDIPVVIHFAVDPYTTGTVSGVEGLVAAMIANLDVGDPLQVSDLIATAHDAQGLDDIQVVYLEINGESVPIVNQNPPTGSRFYLSAIEVRQL